MTWLDMIGWTGSALLVWALFQTRLLRLRALNLVLIGFNAALGVWPGDSYVLDLAPAATGIG
jgi:hypothetical protein